MKNLPLLPSDFKSFSWEESVGNATVEQLQQSYAAITNQGWTTDFSKVVWNDLVDLLYQAIITSGFTWDNTYGSYTSTKMLDKNNVLTSNRFNAVTLNIETIINNSWKWAIDESVKGYLGRSRVYGYEEKWVQADYVYGWYIVELARVLNLLIATLKNEADFAELTGIQVINTNPDVDFTPRPSIPLNVVRQILTINDVTLLAKQSYRLNVLYSIRSRELNELIPRPAERLVTNQKSKTDSDANIDIFKVVRFRSAESSKTDAEAPIRFGKSARFYSNKSHQIDYEAKLTFSALMDIYIINRINSNENTSLKPIISTHFVSDTNSHVTKPYGSLSRISSYHINAKNQSYSNDETAINYIPPFSVKAREETLHTNHEVYMNKPLSNSLGDITEQIHSTFETIITTHNVGYFTSEEESKSNALTDITLSTATPIQGSNKSISTNRGDIISVLPTYIGARYSSYSTYISTIVTPEAKAVKATDEMFTRSLADVVTKKVLDLYSNIKSFSRHVVGLSFEGTDDPWVIQTGSNLYIRQVYSSEQKGNELFIDDNDWLEPIKNGSNLYIRQMYEELNNKED